MTPDIFLLLAFLLTALVLFALEKVPVDLVTLVLIAALVVTGVLEPAQAFSGFANPIIVILASIFVISGALVKTGVMEWLGAALHRLAGDRRGRLMGTVMALSASGSAFLSNTNTTAILMPAVIDASKRARISASRFLMPLAYASILGGACTLIGTSTNMAASGMIQKLGLEPFSMFEFTVVGLAMGGAGMLYMAVLGWRLLPGGPPVSLAEEYRIREYLAHLVIPEESPSVGKTLEEIRLGDKDVTVLSIARGEERLYPRKYTRLRAGDQLTVQASREALLAAKEDASIVVAGDRTADPALKLAEQDLQPEAVQIAEAVVLPQSGLVGRSLRELAFRRRFGVSVLAIYRRGHAYPTRIGRIPLQAGDVLLLQGRQEELAVLEGNHDLWGLTRVDHMPGRRRKGAGVLAALAAAIALGASGALSLPVALLLAAIWAVVTKCLTMEDAYALVEWRLIVLIGGMTSFGVAMDSTGAAEYLAGVIVERILPLGIPAVMTAFVVLTIALTQPMSNAAAALVVLPVALSTASQLGVNPRAFAVLVTLAASLSFITPFEPACLLVYGPGKYRFADFVKAGLPLTAVTVTILLLLVPVFWPL
jgi:di/tricarboxylate transporter